MKTRTKINNPKNCIKIYGRIVFDPIDISNKQISQSSWKKTVMVEIDGDISKYYRYYMRSNFGLNLLPQLRQQHITFISDSFCDIDIEKYEEAKLKYDNTEIILDLDISKVYSNGSHWWFDIYDCDTLTKIRTECGFMPKPYFGYHMTFGITNNKTLSYSKYLVDTFILFDM